MYFPNHMSKIIGVPSALPMQSTHALHMQPPQKADQAENTSSGFAAILQNMIQSVEKTDLESKRLTAQSVYDPNSIEVHKVLLTAEKARFTLNLTKALSDSLVRTFKELTAPR